MPTTTETAPTLFLVRMTAEETSDTSDEELVKRAQRGDRAALDRLVRRHQRALFSLCLRYVRDADEAADLVQRSFVRAMGKLAELRDAGVFRSWILRIGAHLALNHIRDHARFVADDGVIEAGTGDERAQSASAALDRLEAAETASALRAAVSTLPTKQRMTLELRIYEELPFRDIGEALGISEGAAKVNFHYAVRKLRATMSPADGGGAHRGKLK
jgi:RNA polymerase sigma-70 factor, ECF subfamily